MSKRIGHQLVRAGAPLLATAAIAVLPSCGSDRPEISSADGKAIALPGVDGATDFDDILYSKRLGKILVPAVAGGLDLIDPQTRNVIRIGGFETADSADEGRGLVFVADRGAGDVDVVDPRRARIVGSAPTDSNPDYVRYVAATDELWITEPGATPSGIEVMSIGGRGERPAHAGFIAISGGPEGLTVDSRGHRAYTHAFDGELVAIDTRLRREVERWPIGCEGAHGFPQIDERDRLALASCNANGEVALLDADSGVQLGHYAAGGGTSLPAYSQATDHFYVRSDPGETVTTLAASPQGLRVVDQVRVPPDGHCLTADDLGHYWTCVSEAGRILRFTDERTSSSGR